MTKEEAIKFLTKDGNLKVPCSRYGHDSESCAEVAWAAEVIYCQVAPDEMTFDSLDRMMGLVVNNHDDVEYIIRSYGEQYGFKPGDYLDV